MIINKYEVDSNCSGKVGMILPKTIGKVPLVIGTIRRNIVMAGLAVVLVVLMMGCAPAAVEPDPLPEPGEETEAVVSVTAGPGSVFNPEVITVDLGQSVQLVVENLNSINHTFTIDELDIDIRIAPGEQQEITFTPTETGIFEFYCTEPGHRDQGMVGLLGVGEEPDLTDGPAVPDEEDDDDESPGY